MIEWQSVLITLAQKKMPKNSSQTFKSNTFVSRTAHILKVPRVNLELWDSLCRLASLPKGINQRYCLSNQSCQQTRRGQKYKGQFIPVADAAYYLAIDALTLLGNWAFEFSMKSREMLKSEVAPGSKSLCRDSQPITSMLCGDKLTRA